MESGTVAIGLGMREVQWRSGERGNEVEALAAGRMQTVCSSRAGGQETALEQKGREEGERDVVGLRAGVWVSAGRVVGIAVLFRIEEPKLGRLRNPQRQGRMAHLAHLASALSALWPGVQGVKAPPALSPQRHPPSAAQHFWQQGQKTVAIDTLTPSTNEHYLNWRPPAGHPPSSLHWRQTGP